MYYIVYKKEYLSNSGKLWKVGDIRIMQDHQKDEKFDDIVERFANYWDINFNQNGVKVFVLGEIIVSYTDLGLDFYDKDCQKIMWLNNKSCEYLLEILKQKTK